MTIDPLLRMEPVLGLIIVTEGPVRSKVTVLLFVVAVTAVPGLPKRSLKLMLKDAVPSVSLFCMI
jgi:hypothetical protein